MNSIVVKSKIKNWYIEYGPKNNRARIDFNTASGAIITHGEMASDPKNGKVELYREVIVREVVKLTK